MLGVSRKTAIEIIEDVCKRGIIYKEIGGYTDEEIRSNQKKQEKNRYYIQKVEQKEKDVTETSATSSKETVQTVQENDTTNTNNEQEETREHKWYENNSLLDENDMYIYLTTNDKKLKQIAEKRIKALEKSEQGRYVVEQLRSKANERIRDEQRKAEQEMLKQMTNAVRLKNGDIVAVDEKNIDSIDVNEVDCIFYTSSSKQLEYDVYLHSYQPARIENGEFVYDDRPDMIRRAWELYVEHVKTGEMLTCDKGNEMRDQVFDEFFPERKEETKVIVKRERKEDVENKKKKQNDKLQMYREIFEEVYGEDLF